MFTFVKVHILRNEFMDQRKFEKDVDKNKNDNFSFHSLV